MADDDQPKSKSFKSIADILNIDGNNAFDADEADKELKRLEERKRQIDEFKQQFKKIQDAGNSDDYMNGVLKVLVEKGMTMLDALQHEIEDCPKGRDVETAAAMITAISSIVDNINKIKVSNAKIEMENKKLELKKASISGPEITANQNILMVGTTNDLMELLMKKEVIPDNNKLKQVHAEKVEDTEEKK